MSRQSKRTKDSRTHIPAKTPLGPALQKYFCEYLINQRRLSPRTIAAYRDTFRLLLRFFDHKRGRKADDLCVERD